MTYRATLIEIARLLAGALATHACLERKTSVSAAGVNNAASYEKLLPTICAFGIQQYGAHSENKPLSPPCRFLCLMENPPKRHVHATCLDFRTAILWQA